MGPSSKVQVGALAPPSDFYMIYFFNIWYLKSKQLIFNFNLFIPAVLTENILKVWDSHKTQLYCSQIGLHFIDLFV